MTFVIKIAMRCDNFLFLLYIFFIYLFAFLLISLLNFAPKLKLLNDTFYFADMPHYCCGVKLTTTHKTDAFK